MAAYAGSGGKTSFILQLGVPYFYTFYLFRENNSYNNHCRVPHCGLFRLWVVVWAERNFNVAIFFYDFGLCCIIRRNSTFIILVAVPAD
jgi:hypothetical protein